MFTRRTRKVLFSCVILLVVYRLWPFRNAQIKPATRTSKLSGDKEAARKTVEQPVKVEQAGLLHSQRVSNNFARHKPYNQSLDESLLARNGRLPRTALGKPFYWWKDAEPNGWYALPLKRLHNGSLAPSGLTSMEARQAVMYTRIPKTGTRFFLGLVRTLANMNNFYMIYSVVSNKSNIFYERQNFARAVGRIRTPFLLSRYLYFLDFTEFKMAQPMYISMIRDPVELLTSYFNYRRFGDGTHNRWYKKFKGDRNLTLENCIMGNEHECSTENASITIPYFCGQDPRCNEPSDWSLERAKDNVRRYYLAVGLTEDYENSVRVFEKVLPDFFKGIVDLYIPLHSRTKTGTNYKYRPSPEAAKIMEIRLYNEYKFYYFIKERFSALKEKLQI